MQTIQLFTFISVITSTVSGFEIVNRLNVPFGWKTDNFYDSSLDDKDINFYIMLKQDPMIINNIHEMVIDVSNPKGVNYGKYLDKHEINNLLNIYNVENIELKNDLMKMFNCIDYIDSLKCHLKPKDIKEHVDINRYVLNII